VNGQSLTGGLLTHCGAELYIYKGLSTNISPIRTVPKNQQAGHRTRL
jgi:hypothetical protein